MAVPPLLAPKYTPAEATSRAHAFGQMFVLPDDVCRCAFETQPGEIPGESAHERLHKREDHNQAGARAPCRIRFDRARTIYESATQKVPPSIRYGTMRSPGRKIPRPKRKIISANHSMLLRYAATSDCGAG
jgi:hypothetical protein